MRCYCCPIYNHCANLRPSDEMYSQCEITAHEETANQCVCLASQSRSTAPPHVIPRRTAVSPEHGANISTEEDEDFASQTKFR